MNSERKKPEEIAARTFRFASRVVRLCRELDQVAGTSRTLANQLLRSGTPVGANLEEAQAGQSKKDFVAKMYIACKEARETHYWLRLLADTEILPPARIVAAFEDSFFIQTISVQSGLRPPHQFNALDNRSALKVDFFRLAGDEYEFERFRRRTRLELFGQLSTSGEFIRYN